MKIDWQKIYSWTREKGVAFTREGEVPKNGLLGKLFFKIQAWIWENKKDAVLPF